MRSYADVSSKYEKKKKTKKKMGEEYGIERQFENVYLIKIFLRTQFNGVNCKASASFCSVLVLYITRGGPGSIRVSLVHCRY